METQTYQRKPIFVQAVRVTEENFTEVSHWCQGAIVMAHGTTLDTLKNDKTKFIKVRVINPQRVRQTKAFVGDWVLYSEYNGYKVYTNGAFENAFMGPVMSVEEAVEKARETEAAKAAANGREPENERQLGHSRDCGLYGDAECTCHKRNKPVPDGTADKDERVPDGTYGGTRQV